MKNLIPYTDRLTVYAVMLLAIGLLLRYMIGKRRFKRRGFAGLQHFKSYGVALFTIAVERIVNIIALLMIVGGIILYLIK